MSRDRGDLRFLRQLVTDAGDGGVVIVTGAGLSAASGIPTFRGPEGCWTVGAREYRPEELATRRAFESNAIEVWRWYLYRRAVCRRAQPNVGHRAIAELETELGERFRLVTQNVDGLHLRAGSSLERTYQIHGNIDFMRCLDERCEDRLQPIPDSAPLIERSDPLEYTAFEALACRWCQSPARPHVLWFDECYDEELFRAESSLRAAAGASVVVTVGTSGATNLPHQIVRLALARGAVLIDINPDGNPFSELATRHPRGSWLRQTSDEGIPLVAEALIDAAR